MNSQTPTKKALPLQPYVQFDEDSTEDIDIPQQVDIPQQIEENPTLHLLTLIESVEDWTQKSASTLELETYIKKNRYFGYQGDTILLHLIRETISMSNSFWDGDAGPCLLGWMAENSDFVKLFSETPIEISQDTGFFGKLPVHYAIDKKHWSFIRAFLAVCIEYRHRDGGKSKVLDAWFEASIGYQHQNCVHYAIKNRAPFAASMTALCSERALLARDNKGHTPFHLTAIGNFSTTKNVKNRPRLRSSAAKNEILIEKAQQLRWDEEFELMHVLREVQDRHNEDNKLLSTILTMTNNKGESLYQHIDQIEKKLVAKGDAAETEMSEIRNRLRKFIFDKVPGINNVSKALYGTFSNNKELFLDMSDFNWASHDLEKYVDKLVMPAIVDDDDVVDGGSDENGADSNDSLYFEDTLLLVILPDMDCVKQPCHPRTLHTLLQWLRHTKGVKTIQKLVIPDNTTNPMSSAFFDVNILSQVRMQSLDWRRLDMDLDILVQSVQLQGSSEHHEAQVPLRELTLYSSGNWSVLYHWISKDGLAKLPDLRTVHIDIIALDRNNDEYDNETRARHSDLVREYKTSLENMHSENRRLFSNDDTVNFDYHLNILVDAKWPYATKESFEELINSPPTYPLFHVLDSCRVFLSQQKRLKEPRTTNSNQDTESTEANNLLEEYLPYKHSLQSCLKLRRDRIKIAIIDNGTDKVRASIGGMIAKGISFLGSGSSDSDQTRPWWMVSDAHGTQMASLIAGVNPFCRLYIARVGSGRKDIDPENAAKAIHWALEQEVDIISMSWTTKINNDSLYKEVKKAADGKSGRATLMFCSTADEGHYSGNIYPANYKREVLSVSMTDHLGNVPSRVSGVEKADIYIPGENTEIPDASLSHIASVPSHMTGSSVATALAAGIASLALVLLKTYNQYNDEDMAAFYTRDGMKRIFQKMNADQGGIQLPRLFPDLDDGEAANHKILKDKWDTTNWEKES